MRKLAPRRKRPRRRQPKRTVIVPVNTLKTDAASSQKQQRQQAALQLGQEPSASRATMPALSVHDREVAIEPSAARAEVPAAQLVGDKSTTAKIQNRQHARRRKRVRHRQLAAKHDEDTSSQQPAQNVDSEEAGATGSDEEYKSPSASRRRASRKERERALGIAAAFVSGESGLPSRSRARGSFGSRTRNFGAATRAGLPQRKKSSFAGLSRKGVGWKQLVARTQREMEAKQGTLAAMVSKASGTALGAARGASPRRGSSRGASDASRSPSPSTRSPNQGGRGRGRARGRGGRVTRTRAIHQRRTKSPTKSKSSNSGAGGGGSDGSGGILIESTDV